MVVGRAGPSVWFLKETQRGFDPDGTHVCAGFKRCQICAAPGQPSEIFPAFAGRNVFAKSTAVLDHVFLRGGVQEPRSSVKSNINLA